MKLHKVDNNNGEGDWKALYIDGVRALEGHQLDLSRVIRLIMEMGEPIDEFRETSYDDEQIEEIGGGFPFEEGRLPDMDKQ